MHRYTVIAPILLALVLTGCMTPYRSALQQGNLVTQEMVDKLKPGMTKSQVRFVLGTPLVIDSFHEDRWDYVYLFRADSDSDKAPERYHLAVIFKGDALKQLEGNVVNAAVPRKSRSSDNHDVATTGAVSTNEAL